MEGIPGRVLGAFETAIRATFGGLLIGYQTLIRPWLGDRCRFYPSCSDYAKQTLASREIPWVFGLLFVIWRLLRCHPFSRGGVDLPPQRSHQI